ncbi:RsmB/NOP family class I SAM-dependent RNA methyltransferase [Oharaeibacter diazotrophicus]|uniref:16S rRNA (Cytosine967-C5)-methyltransferase n=1 Tax=Oharaeibacter diazotrophicus TaxID=1920512 RepID=A0A4R6RJ89_9HYPH|nr:RsmB/NOP family class I SAM-dependent RNA methyltransferase [Oharaeibacter diazotrophicus]TDP86583.1 16S rRNA (cytosine967-C5)-methyltransferase [Oharaeibacter diazotrophicus]BBE71475.1 ribosomal RNA small subunit methyltransferase B [Pleomorphomonas sp. SM30]
MKDGGRIAAAIEVLADVDRTRRPVQDALKDWGLTHRFAGSRDRSAIGNLVFDVLRRRASLAARMGSEDPRLLASAAYALLWGKGLDGLLAALADDRHAPAAPSEAERAALLAPDLPEGTPAWARADVPAWLEASLTRAFGDRLPEEGAALSERAEIDLRVNPLKSDRAAVLEALAPLGAVACRWSPVGVRVPAGATDDKPPHVASELSFKRGWYEVQDEGSQIAALIAAAIGGGQVVDLCAGAGGKTLALAAAMGNRGQIYAYDSDKRRFGDILERIARAGARNIQIREPRRGDVLADLVGKADLVLIDAPCTGSGTWRRRPDAKWRLAPGALETRLKEQDAVLSDGARLVRPGGHLVYVTCSVLPEENEDRAGAFLAAEPSFRMADTAALFTAATGAAPPPHATVPLAGGTALRLSPATAGTDGFFVAVFARG